MFQRSRAVFSMKTITTVSNINGLSLPIPCERDLSRALELSVLVCNGADRVEQLLWNDLFPELVL